MKLKLNGKDYLVTSEYNAIDSMHKQPHTGIDLLMNEGTQIHSPVSGVIEKVVDYGGANIGKGVIIKTPDGERLILGHLSDNTMVQKGQIISQGDLVGISGNTGRSSGAHLHVGLRDSTTNNFMDPEKYLHGDTLAPPTEIAANPIDTFAAIMEQFNQMLAEMKVNCIFLIDVFSSLLSLGGVV